MIDEKAERKEPAHGSRKRRRDANQFPSGYALLEESGERLQLAVAYWTPRRCWGDVSFYFAFFSVDCRSPMLFFFFFFFFLLNYLENVNIKLKKLLTDLLLLNFLYLVCVYTKIK